MLKSEQDLKGHHLFSEFNSQELAKISTNSHYQTLRKGQNLFQQNKIATNFFLNIHGKIKLAFLSAEGNEKVMDIISDGQSFAEAIIFLDNKRYPLDATALIPSIVLCINAQCYLDILKQSPKTCLKIMGKLSQRLHWAVNEINHLTLHDGTYRLVSFLLNNMQQDAKVYLLMPKQVLASQLAIKPETLSRIFNKLSEKGLLKVYKSHIHLLAVPELQHHIKLEVKSFDFQN